MRSDTTHTTLTRLAATAAALMLATTMAEAASFDFEAVAPAAFTGAAVPDGYAGATWTGMLLRRTTDSGLQSSGFVLNGTTMALVTDTAPSITFAAPTIYGGAFIGNAARNGSAVSYDLYLGDTLAASSGNIGAFAAFLPSIYNGPVDRIVFHVASDNLMSLDEFMLTSPVPEAQNSLMMLAGLASIGGLLRRRLALVRSC